MWIVTSKVKANGGSVDKDYWEDVWRNEDLGFHQPQVNRHLQRFWQRLQLVPTSRVFVPLCGKSLDMDWLLSEGHEVIGADIVEKAQEEYLVTHDEPVRYTEENKLKLAWQGRMLFVAGDIMHLEPDMLRSVDAVYDRAALIALPRAARQNYALFLAHCLKPGAKMLLITRQAPEEQLAPPFNVSAAEVEELYAPNFMLERLLREKRQDGVVEEVFLLKRKQPAGWGRLPREAGEAQN